MVRWPDFIPSWASAPGVRIVDGDFNGNGLTDLALVRQTPGWGSIPVAFSDGDGAGTSRMVRSLTSSLLGESPGVKVVAGISTGTG